MSAFGVTADIAQTYGECDCLEVILSEHDVCGIDVRKLSTFAVLLMPTTAHQEVADCCFNVPFLGLNY